MTTYIEPNNVSSITGMFQYANDVTDGTFVTMLLISIYLVPLIYLMMRNHNWLEAGIVAGFTVAITAIFMRVAEILTNETYVFISVTMLVIPLVISYIQGQRQ